MRLVKIFVSATVTTFVVLALFFYLYVNSNINTKEDFYLYVKNGDNFSNITKTLVENSIIKNRKIFVLSSKILSKNNVKIYRGEFLIKKDSKIIWIRFQCHQQNQQWDML